jgi:hypothetical protein
LQNFSYVYGFDRLIARSFDKEDFMLFWDYPFENKPKKELFVSFGFHCVMGCFSTFEGSMLLGN